MQHEAHFTHEISAEPRIVGGASASTYRELLVAAAGGG